MLCAPLLKCLDAPMRCDDEIPPTRFDRVSSGLLCDNHLSFGCFHNVMLTDGVLRRASTALRGMNVGELRSPMTPPFIEGVKVAQVP